ncbi:MAG: TonB-dependent receptor [Chitinophagaceae bacterium]
MKRIYLLVLTLSVFTVTHAQRGFVAGSIYDSASSRPVGDATVTVLNRKDSSLVSFSMTGNSGDFRIGNLPDGEYRLLATHVNYHNLSKNFSIRQELRELQLGVMLMLDKSVLLKEVVVNSEVPPVSMVGDTVMYHADAFKTPPNASVEQLLRKLPGVQVDKDGNIRSNGQNVGRVLVDGKEFFGNDPKMATRNLPANAIDKVQLYDRQSDQSLLTGFDDGNSEKTINLRLKKDKKKGGFGSLAAGAGTDERKEGRVNLNSFKGARQLSVIGMANNTNTEGFSFSDMLNFSGDLSRLSRGTGGLSSDQLSSSGASSSTNSGIRTIWGGGLNYNNLLGNHTDFTSNYFYNNYNPATHTDLERRYLLPDSTYNFRQASFNNTDNSSHRLNLGFDHRIDSFHSFKINPSVGIQHTRSVLNSQYQQSGSDGRLSNSGFNNYEKIGDAVNLQTDLLFRKKFRKKGRTFSISMKAVFNESDSKANQQSSNEFFAASGNSFRDSINQFSLDKADMHSLTGRAVYTEPLFRRSLLEFSVGKSSTRSSSARAAYDFNKVSHDYDVFNDSLSNDFETTYGYTNAGVRLRSIRKKISYSVGLVWQNATLDGRVIKDSRGSDLRKAFNNLLPNVRAQYTFIRNKSLTLNYSTNTSQPSVTQLQPVPDISNALNIYEGNPQLKQEFSHNLSLNYTGINPFRNRNLFVFLTLNRTDNKIVNADSVFATGVKKTRPVNTDGVYSANGDINLGLPVRFLKGNVQVGARSSFNRGRQFINGLPNTISALTLGPRFTLNMAPTDKIDLQVSSNFNFNRTAYSLQRAFNTNYFSQVYEAEFNWELPRYFFLATEFTYTINNQLGAGFNARVPLWNASIAKQILKSRKAELRLRVNDLLNRNTGVNRTSNQSYIEDSRVNTLKRYGLLSFTYNLSKAVTISDRR